MVIVDVLGEMLDLKIKGELDGGTIVYAYKGQLVGKVSHNISFIVQRDMSSLLFPFSRYAYMSIVYPRISLPMPHIVIIFRYITGFVLFKLFLD